MPSFSRPLEETLHRAVGYANARRHEYATLEHLLLALIDDPDATVKAVEEQGGKFHPGPEDAPENAEVKFRDPDGIVFDISAHGWDGAKR